MEVQSDLPRPGAHSLEFPQPGPSICLLGELRIAAGGQPLPSPPYRTHSLLAALLLYPHPQRRERLLGLLFPDAPERKGRQRLSYRLWELRQALPGLPLETSAREVCLPSEARWLDVEAFRRAAARDDLDADTVYRWRARVLHAPFTVDQGGVTPPPNPAHGPWRRYLGQVVEADLRTTEAAAPEWKVFLPVVVREPGHRAPDLEG